MYISSKFANYNINRVSTRYVDSTSRDDPDVNVTDTYYYIYYIKTAYREQNSFMLVSSDLCIPLIAGHVLRGLSF